VNVDRELADGHYKASVVYAFTISNGLVNTRGNVVLSEGGVEIIEQMGKDPKTAARIALERLLKQGRDPVETQIFLRVPYGHAEHFSKNGNYEALPTLTE
jgi:antitoxin component of RelBE/YafQ-DinJ toxin-antitoxin module